MERPKSFDDSPPKMRLILGTTFICIATLVVLKFVFDSYFDSLVSSEKLVKTETKTLETYKREREAQRESLRQGPLTVDDAIKTLASKGRLQVDRVRPEPSSDEGAMDGWVSQRKAWWE